MYKTELINIRSWIGEELRFHILSRRVSGSGGLLKEIFSEAAMNMMFLLQGIVSHMYPGDLSVIDH